MVYLPVPLGYRKGEKQRKRCVPGADPVYPPSLYRAVSYASTLGVPVYILENGMPSKEVRGAGSLLCP